MKSLFIATLFFASFSLVSCGDATRSLSMLPTPLTPLVLDQDFTDNSEVAEENTAGTVYKANLIRFKFQIRNDHSSSVVILGVRFTVTDPVSREERVINVSIDKIITGVASGGRELQPGEKITDTETSGSISTEHEDKFIYLDSLPKEESSTSFKYTIKAEVQGWIGTQSQVESRLTSIYNFTTF